MTPFKRKRCAAGLSIEAMARKLKVNIKTVHSWEHGRTPQPPMFPKIAKLLGMTPEDVTHLFDKEAAAA